MRMKLNEFLNEFLIFIKNRYYVYQLDKQLILLQKGSTSFNNYKTILEGKDLLEDYYLMNGIEQSYLNEMSDEDIKKIADLNTLKNLNEAQLISSLKNHSYEIDSSCDEFRQYIVLNGELVRVQDLKKVEPSKVLPSDLLELFNRRFWVNVLEQKNNVCGFDRWWNENLKYFLNHTNLSLEELKKKRISETKILNQYVFILLYQMSNGDMFKAKWLSSWMKLSLTSLKPETLLVWIYGQGGDGKSLLKNLWMYLSDKTRYLEVTTSMLKKNSEGQDFQSLNFLNKYCVIGDEVSDFDIEKIKNLTSMTSTITADRKNQSTVSFGFRGKLTLINNVPFCLENYSLDGREALRRRVCYFETKKVETTEYTTMIFKRCKDTRKKPSEVLNKVINFAFNEALKTGFYNWFDKRYFELNTENTIKNP